MRNVMRLCYSNLSSIRGNAIGFALGRGGDFISKDFYGRTMHCREFVWLPRSR